MTIGYRRERTQASEARPHNKAKVQLPGKLSELIRVAINDAYSLDRGIYDPHASYYHTGLLTEDRIWDLSLKTNRCHVCFAGAVLAGTLKVPLHLDSGPAYCPHHSLKLNALDAARVGMYSQALDNLGIHPTPTQIELIRSLKDPVHIGFQGWHHFDKFLIDMDILAATLDTYNL